jgi:phosphotransferase system HPr (HPr) family protein
MNSVQRVNGPLRRVVAIANPHGMHVRPAAAFAERASRFASQVRVSLGEKNVDGKFWPDLLLLEAAGGAQLTLEVEGPDAAEALDALTDQLAVVFTDEPPPIQPGH